MIWICGDPWWYSKQLPSNLTEATNKKSIDDAEEKIFLPRGVCWVRFLRPCRVVETCPNFFLAILNSVQWALTLPSHCFNCSTGCSVSNEIHRNPRSYPNVTWRANFLRSGGQGFQFWTVQTATSLISLAGTGLQKSESHPSYRGLALSGIRDPIHRWGGRMIRDAPQWREELHSIRKQ